MNLIVEIIIGIIILFIIWLSYWIYQIYKFSNNKEEIKYTVWTTEGEHAVRKRLFLSKQEKRFCNKCKKYFHLMEKERCYCEDYKNIKHEWL